MKYHRRLHKPHVKPRQLITSKSESERVLSAIK